MDHGGWVDDDSDALIWTSEHVTFEQPLGQREGHFYEGGENVYLEMRTDVDLEIAHRDMIVESMWVEEITKEQSIREKKDKKETLKCREEGIKEESSGSSEWSVWEGSGRCKVTEIKEEKFPESWLLLRG